MSPASTVVQWAAFGLAGLLALTAVAGVVAPQVAPDVMTMGTMDALMGVDRYQDRGTCDFWVVNMSRPVERIERDFACSFYWDWSLEDAGSAYVHEALYDLERDQVFEVPNMARGNMEEFYHVDGHMLTPDALSFQVEAEEDPGVLMPPPGARDEVTMGWVASGGERGGEERLVVPRELREVDTRSVEGLDVVAWNSSFERVQTTWHGYDIYLTEHVDMVGDPKTGWVLEMRRHVKVEMTPAQMADAFGQPIPSAIGDPGEPQSVMALVYQTSPGAIDDHADRSKDFRQIMRIIEDGDTFADVGAGSSLLFAVAGVCTRTAGRLFPEPPE